MNGDIIVARGALERSEIEQHIAHIWSDLAFDDAAKAALKLDGLALDTLRPDGAKPLYSE